MTDILVPMDVKDTGLAIETPQAFEDNWLDREMIAIGIGKSFTEPILASSGSPDSDISIFTAKAEHFAVDHANLLRGRNDHAPFGLADEEELSFSVLAGAFTKWCQKGIEYLERESGNIKSKYSLDQLNEASGKYRTSLSVLEQYQRSLQNSKTF